MLTKNFAGTNVDVNDEGYLTDPSQWNKEVGAAIAAEEGITELTDAHWKVIDYCRANPQGKAAPTLRAITIGSGISTKEMFTLFPKGPAKKVARIAGLGKPEGCV